MGKSGSKWIWDIYDALGIFNCVHLTVFTCAIHYYNLNQNGFQGGGICSSGQKSAF